MVGVTCSMCLIKWNVTYILFLLIKIILFLLLHVLITIHDVILLEKIKIKKKKEKEFSFLVHMGLSLPNSLLFL